MEWRPSFCKLITIHHFVRVVDPRSNIFFFEARKIYLSHGWVDPKVGWITWIPDLRMQMIAIQILSGQDREASIALRVKFAFHLPQKNTTMVLYQSNFEHA